MVVFMSALLFVLLFIVAMGAGALLGSTGRPFNPVLYRNVCLCIVFFGIPSFFVVHYLVDVGATQTVNIITGIAGLVGGGVGFTGARQGW